MFHLPAIHTLSWYSLIRLPLHKKNPVDIWLSHSQKQYQRDEGHPTLLRTNTDPPPLTTIPRAYSARLSRTPASSLPVCIQCLLLWRRLWTSVCCCRCNIKPNLPLPLLSLRRSCCCCRCPLFHAPGSFSRGADARTTHPDACIWHARKSQMPRTAHKNQHPKIQRTPSEPLAPPALLQSPAVLETLPNPLPGVPLACVAARGG